MKGKNGSVAGRCERIASGAVRRVDLRFVIGNSPLMAAHQSRIADNLTRVRQLFHPRDFDYRIGVLTTDGVNAEPGRRPGDQPYVKEVRSVELDPVGNPVTQYNARNPQKITPDARWLLAES